MLFSNSKRPSSLEAAPLTGRHDSQPYSCLLALAVTAALPSAQTKRSPDALAKDLQARYQSIRDFSADFVQSYRAGVLKTKTQESGKVSVKKPGKMRWTYAKPERKELVSDGRQLYAYVPEDKQVIVRDATTQAATPDLFLSGRGDIARDFTRSPTSIPPIPGTSRSSSFRAVPSLNTNIWSLTLDPALCRFAR